MFESCSGSVQLPADIPGKSLEYDPTTWERAPMWGILKKLWAPGAGLAQTASPLWPFRE